ncbi:MAG: UDP-N-acetylmuramoyl-tripeptide--D-alanyl-D-alanine ligase [Melioribacteraceae bacterium]|nr:UDP-N-acetylmuramoyl-tripeptide--D-alanyl-D-alanine ligase [Melioribacteraceae bacterium]
MGKIKITLEDLFNLPSAVIYNPDRYKPVSVVQIDSRKIVKGSLFVAIKGEKFDGHDFVKDVVKKGAGAVIIDCRMLSKFNSIEIPFITVYDTAAAFGNLANIWRNKLKAKVVSITGSTGKTTTKEIAATLLSEKYKVVKTEANNNNHIGVPLTILSADEKCDVLVLEQGTNHIGEIPYSVKISEPDISIITNIGESHIEFLKNKQMVYKEKSALFDATEKRGGIILANTDDPIIKKNVKRYSNVVSFGFQGNPYIKGKINGFTDDGKTKIKITGSKSAIDLPIYGESGAKNFLAAAVIAKLLGLSNDEIKKGTRKLFPVHGRLEVKKYSNALVIDDTYNSSPASINAAYDFVKHIKTFKSKIVVLGDIFELGKHSPKIHKELSKIFSYDKNLFVLTIGKMMSNLTAELRKKKIKSIHFHLREALSLYLQYEEIDNSVILVKGSRGMKMEEFVNILEKRFE